MASNKSISLPKISRAAPPTSGSNSLRYVVELMRGPVAQR